MKRIAAVLSLLILPAWLFTGCADLSEPEAAGIVMAFGITSTDNNQIEVIAQDITLTSGGQQMQKSNWTFDIHKATGPTVYDAMQNISREDPEKVYLSHAKVIILSEEFARSQGLRTIVDYMKRNPSIRQNSLFFIAKAGEFEKVFLPDAKLNMDTGKIVEKVIKENSYYSFIVDSKLRDFLRNSLEPYCTPYALGIWSTKTFADNQNMNQGYDTTGISTYGIEVGDIAVFKDYKLTGWLMGENSIGYMLAKGEAKGGCLNVIYDGKRITVQLSKIESKIKPGLKNDKITADINVKVDADIVNSDPGVDFEDINVNQSVKVLIEEQMKADISKAFGVSKGYSTDIFEIGNMVFKNYPAYWKQHGDGWMDTYPKLENTIQADATIRHIGIIKIS